MLGTWPIAARNLLRNRKRNIATGSAIALGFAAMLALSGYINRVEKYLQAYTIYANRSGHITIFAHNGLENYTTRPKAYSLTQEVQEDIEKTLVAIPNVQLYGGQLFGTGLAGNGCRSVPFVATGVSPKLDRLLREHPVLLQWASKRSKISKGSSLSDYPENLGGILAANGLARILGKPNVYSEVPPDQASLIITDCSQSNVKSLIAKDANIQLATSSWEGSMSALDAEIIGQYDPGVTEIANSGILAPLSFMQKLLDTNHVTQYSIWLRNPALLKNNLELIQQTLVAKGHQLDFYTWDDERLSPMYAGTMQFLQTMVNFLTVVLGVVIVFSIFNSATMTIIERSQEIGMMRSIGYKRSQLRRLFLQESLILTGVAIMIGLVIGFLFIIGINLSDIYLYPPGISGGLKLELRPDFFSTFFSAFFIFILAFVATSLALRNIIKKGIPDLLMGTNR
jgi:putative ABC transport system permease protein